MMLFRSIGVSLLLAGVASAHENSCAVGIEAGDQLQFSKKEIAVPASCTDVEVTLRNSGSQPANTMGHDWVLAKESDMPAIVDAAQSAGSAQGYLPRNDKRVIAATSLVGGGESASVRFNTSQLEPGTHYAFFCTFPAHSGTMHGRFVLESK